MAVYRFEARRAALAAATVLLVLTLVLPLAGRAFAASRASTVAILSGGGVLAALALVAALVLGLVAPRQRLGTEAAVARWVGRRVRPLASDLLSSVELDGADPRAAPSRALVDALVEATARRLEGLEPRALLPRADLVRVQRWAALALVANAALVAAAPRAVLDGWRALLVAPPRPFGGAELSPVPLVGDLSVELTAPAYARRPPVRLPSSSGDVRGLPGTVVRLRARVLAPARAAELVLELGDQGASSVSLPAHLDHDQLAVELVITGPARYRFALTSPDGRRSIEATPRAIEPEPDRAPTVQLVAPAEVLDVTNLRRVELAYVIEDDFAVAGAELAWESGKEHGRTPLPVAGAGRRAQGKFIWDIAEVQPAPGGEVRYWLEARDDDAVGGPNVGRSRELRLRVTSPRERHEETLARQQDVAEKLLRVLGGRLTLGAAPPAQGGDEPGPRDELARQTRDLVVELGSLAAAFEKDPHASDALRKVLAGMRERLDRLASAEARLLQRPRGEPAPAPARFAASDPRMIAELEDDVMALADWLDRERLEGLLDLDDEIAAHQARLKELLEQYARTPDPRLKEEIDRQLRALDRTLAERGARQRGMAQDVLDQFVNPNAPNAGDTAGCTGEVAALVRAGKIAEAQARLAACAAGHARDAAGLEAALSALRGDRFGDEQKKLDEVMNELADVARDQDDIAAEASRIHEAYDARASSLAKENRREASRTIGALVERLRLALAEAPDPGLTPFAREELDVVERRLADVEHTVADGDLAEALGMADQARASLDTVGGELDGALGDERDPRAKQDAQLALEALERARPIADELVAALKALAPRADQILGEDDQRALERLRRRQAMNRQRAGRLAERTRQLGSELPGDAARELDGKLGGAGQQMGLADERMKAGDPSGARDAARAAADALAKARDRARSAARQAQQGAVSDEPVRIPGADEYRAPERFREDVLEAMKKKGAQAPDGYGEQIRRYYEELIR